MDRLAERPVDVDLAELQRVDRAHHRRVVAAEHVGRQAVARVVGDAERLVEGVDAERSA